MKLYSLLSIQEQYVLMMYFDICLGGAVGFLLKRTIDLIRSAITSGQDKCMLSFSYTLKSDNARQKINLKEE